MLGQGVGITAEAQLVPGVVIRVSTKVQALIVNQIPPCLLFAQQVFNKGPGMSTIKYCHEIFPFSLVPLCQEVT